MEEMKYNSNIHHRYARSRPPYHRRSIRLPTFDYSSAEQYFVTICTQNRRKLFGRIINERMELDRFGYIVKRCIQELPNHFNTVRSNAFIVMPNHIHLIIQIKNIHRAVGAGSPRPFRDGIPQGDKAAVIKLRSPRPFGDGIPQGDKAVVIKSGSPRPFRDNACSRGGETPPLRHLDRSRPSLGHIVARMKYESTKRINRMIGTPGKPIWQRNYLERIIQTDEELFDTIEYIMNNPKKWANDPNK